MNWLTDSWRTLLPPVWAEIALVLVAAISGSIVGAERERREKAAGLRTLILVCLGAATFTMASYSFPNDSGRVAAQIVAGIGFLGAGVILHGRGTVSGTTTAATIWVTASIGMVVGTGHATAALGLSTLVRLVLGAASYVEWHIVSEHQELTAEIDYDPSHGRTRVRMERVLIEYNVPSKSAEWRQSAGDSATVILHLQLPRRHLRELLDDLVDVPEVKAIRENRARPPLPTPRNTG